MTMVYSLLIRQAQWNAALQKHTDIILKSTLYCVILTKFYFGLSGFNASATARVIMLSRRWKDDDEISVMVDETGLPGGNHRPTASNWRNFSHIRPLPSLLSLLMRDESDLTPWYQVSLVSRKCTAPASYLVRLPLMVRTWLFACLRSCFRGDQNNHGALDT